MGRGEFNPGLNMQKEGDVRVVRDSKTAVGAIANDASKVVSVVGTPELLDEGGRSSAYAARRSHITSRVWGGPRPFPYYIGGLGRAAHALAKWVCCCRAGGRGWLGRYVDRRRAEGPPTRPLGLGFVKGVIGWGRGPTSRASAAREGGAAATGVCGSAGCGEVAPWRLTVGVPRDLTSARGRRLELLVRLYRTHCRQGGPAISSLCTGPRLSGDCVCAARARFGTAGGKAPCRFPGSGRRYNKALCEHGRPYVIGCEPPLLYREVDLWYARPLRAIKLRGNLATQGPVS